MVVERGRAFWFHYEEAHTDFTTEREHGRLHKFVRKMVRFAKTDHAILGLAPAAQTIPDLEDHIW